ncbi:MAG: RnfABCDGE type electron transport complex subunit D [Flavobacteriales bacterium]
MEQLTSRFKSFGLWLESDARHFQIISQVIFLLYGILYLGWETYIINVFFAFAGALSFQGLFIASGLAPRHSLKSAFISSLGLSLLLKANSPILFFIAGAMAIGQKFAFRYNGKHLWNPANFAIVLLILLSGNAWISPGQWGSGAILVLIISTAGMNVLSRVKRLDMALAFLLTYAIAEYSRTILYLGWNHEVLFHKLCNGSVWLFALFMITDPMTSPNNRTLRILWTMLIALASFYIINFHFFYAAPQFILFALTPFVPLIDKAFKGEKFFWQKQIHLIPSQHD